MDEVICNPEYVYPEEILRSGLVKRRLEELGFDILDIDSEASKFMKDFPILQERVEMPVHPFWNVIVHQLEKN